MHTWLNAFPERHISLIVVAHIIPNVEIFLEVLSRLFHIAFIIPKPNSIHQETYHKLKEYPIWECTRGYISNNQAAVLEKINATVKNEFVILDIWGYFASLASRLSEVYGQRFLWIIEDTENGLQRYEKQDILLFPFISVARSILKEPEDYLVWESIVFATEFILRSFDVLLKNKQAMVIGFWKIGRSIVRHLYNKKVGVLIYDCNLCKGIEALAYGYSFSKERGAIFSADIIFSATGNMALKGDDFLKLKDGCILVSVTSSDDEIDIGFLEKNFHKESINSYADEYSHNWKKIIVINQWNSVNFAIQTWVWAFIRLLQAEILHALRMLVTWQWKEKVSREIPNSEKEYIAAYWLHYFGS